jgi:hypothetical protein
MKPHNVHMGCPWACPVNLYSEKTSRITTCISTAPAWRNRTQHTVQTGLRSSDSPSRKSHEHSSSRPSATKRPSDTASPMAPCDEEVYHVERNFQHVYDTLSGCEPFSFLPSLFSIRMVDLGPRIHGSEEGFMPLSPGKGMRPEEDVGRVPESERKGPDCPYEDRKARRMRPGHCI